MRSFVRKVCCITILIASGGLSLYAQTSVGRISGTVKDGSGAVVPDATITVTNVATNVERTAVTDDSGFYTVTNLPVGTYSLSAERKGFKKVVQADNSLTADARLTVDLTLQLGCEHHVR